MKRAAPASTSKKVVAVLRDGSQLRGYLNPAQLGQNDPLDLLTTDGEHQPIPLASIRCVYFVRDFNGDFQLGRKAFLSRPKLEGLWVRLTFRDKETIEGIVSNDLLAILDSGVQITPPDLNGQCLRIFIPRSALTGMTVLGVIGAARRKPARPVPAAGQTTLFEK